MHGIWNEGMKIVKEQIYGQVWEKAYLQVDNQLLIRTDQIWPQINDQVQYMLWDEVGDIIYTRNME